MSELYHYGVKGMKWGVRRAQKKEYGLSKHQVKKRIKDAKKNNRTNNGGTFNGSTGKNWDEVVSKHKKAFETDETLQTYTKSRNDAYRKAESYYDKGDFDKSERYQDIGDQYATSVNKRRAEIGKQFTSQYSNALLKDINYDDLAKGRKMLKEYGIKNDWGKYR